MVGDPNEFRRDWRLLWLASIADLSDLDAQHQRWLDPAADPSGSYVGFVENYYGILLLSAGYEGGVASGYLSRAEAAAVEPFNRALAGYRPPRGSNAEPTRILDDAAWHHVVAAARRARDKLAELLACPAERAALAGATDGR